MTDYFLTFIALDILAAGVLSTYRKNVFAVRKISERADGCARRVPARRSQCVRAVTLLETETVTQ
jgi:hypothetical protein